MTFHIGKVEERRDVDLDLVRDSDTDHERVERLKKHLRRPIEGRELGGEPYEHGDALRRHADLDSIPEHPFMRQLRELREARDQ